MRLIDKIIIAMGHDKVIHLLCGALITSLFGFFGIVTALVGWVVTLILSVVKEYLDDQVDMYDVVFAMIGATAAVMVMLVLWLFG